MTMGYAELMMKKSGVSSPSKEKEFIMSKYTTVVIRMPEDAEGRKQVEQALNLLKPHQTAMSLEDEMTILELIEQHEDFPDYITAKGMSALAAMKEQKAECSACGSTEYEGELKACTYCDGTKCSMCDTGDDCACLACEAHD